MGASFCVGCSFMTRDATFSEDGAFGFWHRTPVGNHCPACVAAYEVFELPFEPSWVVFKDHDGEKIDVQKFVNPAEGHPAIRRCDATLHPDVAKHYKIDPKLITAIDVRAWKADNLQAQTMCIVTRRVPVKAAT